MQGVLLDFKGTMSRDGVLPFFFFLHKRGFRCSPIFMIASTYEFTESDSVYSLKFGIQLGVFTEYVQ